MLDPRPLIRFIAGIYPDTGIFTKVAKNMPPLGLVLVATSASEAFPGFRVEIIDENNYKGPLDENGLPDHKRLQQEDPAAAVGFYTGMTCTMDRVYELTRFYHGQGIFAIAGGWHAHYLPQEALDNGFDVVVHGDGEIAIKQILNAWKNHESFSAIPGISYLESGHMKTNLIEGQEPDELPFLQIPDLNTLPFPNFNLIKYAGKIKLYPISRIRGCRWNCEFCSVKGKVRWANAQYMFKLIQHLWEKGVREIFIVDDRLEEEDARDDLLLWFNLIAQKFGRHIKFVAQVRGEIAKDLVLVKAMWRAGVRNICIGNEATTNAELREMHKGFTIEQIAEWIKILKRYFWVHLMFIFGYPNKVKSTLSVEERINQFKEFILQTEPDSIQVLHLVAIPGAKVRTRLEGDKRVLPLTMVPWSKYDGSWAGFLPDDMSFAELQEGAFKLMEWFYSGTSIVKIPLRAISLLSVVYPIIIGWRRWSKSLTRESVKYGGHLLMQNWGAYKKSKPFAKKLEEYFKSGQQNTS